MTSANLIRWCGLAAILGAALFIIADLIGLFTLDFDASPSEFFTSFGFYLTSALLLVGGPLVQLGLVGLYAGRPEAMGVLGLIAFLGAFFGGVLSQGAICSESFISPAIASEAPELLESEPPGVVIFGILLSFVLVNLGWILFGVAVLRSRQSDEQRVIRVTYPYRTRPYRTRGMENVPQSIMWKLEREEASGVSGPDR